VPGTGEGESVVFLEAGAGRAGPSRRSRGSRSGTGCIEEGVAGLASGEVTGETRGEVWRDSGTSAEVSKTKKASPPSPSFMA